LNRWRGQLKDFDSLVKEALSVFMNLLYKLDSLIHRILSSKKILSWIIKSNT